MIKKKFLIIMSAVIIVAAVSILVWFVGFKKPDIGKEQILSYTKFTSDSGFEVEYPNWKKLDILNPTNGMPTDLVAKENLKILLYVTNGAAVVQISERTFDPKSLFKDNINSMVKNQKDSVKDLLIWRRQIDSTTALLETESTYNGIPMHTLSKAFDAGSGKIYSVAFITAKDNYGGLKEVAEHVVYSAKVLR